MAAEWPDLPLRTLLMARFSLGTKTTKEEKKMFWLNLFCQHKHGCSGILMVNIQGFKPSAPLTVSRI